MPIMKGVRCMEVSNRVAIGLMFYPRGGSAQVVRYLRPAMNARGWETPLVTGSLGPEGALTNAATFYGPGDLITMDYTQAVETWQAGGDPIAAPWPLHPSYEDREGVPDRVFTAVSPQLSEHLISAWQQKFAGCGLDDAELFHLHHLTPHHEAVTRLWPDKPIVGHLHGTEVKMLENIHERRQIALRLGMNLAELATLHEQPGPVDLTYQLDLRQLNSEQLEIFETTDWTNWRYAAFWEAKMLMMAHLCERVIVISPHDRDLAKQLLRLEARCIDWIPNGVDTELFKPRDLASTEKLALWRRWLIDDAQGWDESGKPGTVRYQTGDLEMFSDPATGELRPVLMFVGRFLDFKRVPMLIRAFQQARARFDMPAPLVIWGGSPGEWEGEHPYSVAQEGGDRGIFFTGWRGHHDLPDGLNCADVMVAPSFEEPFGQVYLEAMVSGVPVIATRSGGPPSFVNTEPGKPNGWLIPPDNQDALAAALIEAVNSEASRRLRGEHAYAQITRDYSWSGLAEQFVRVYRQAIGRRVTV